MQNLTPWEICAAVVGGLLALAAAINTLGSAWEKVVKARNAAKAPGDAQDNRLAALEKDMEHVMICLDNDKRHLDTLDEGNRVTQQSLLALLSHAIDGNNIRQLQEAEESLQKYLINR